MDYTAKSLRPGELAKRAGVSSDTLRHYERLGIVSSAPRTASGYRRYAPDALERVNLVQRALQLGFSLAELSGIFRARDKGKAPCRRVLSLAEEKLHVLEQRIQELRQAQHYMQALVHDWRVQLVRAAPGNKAMLLHSLTRRPALRARPWDSLGRSKQA